MCTRAWLTQLTRPAAGTGRGSPSWCQGRACPGCPLHSSTADLSFMTRTALRGRRRGAARRPFPTPDGRTPRGQGPSAALRSAPRRAGCGRAVHGQCPPAARPAATSLTPLSLRTHYTQRAACPATINAARLRAECALQQQGDFSFVPTGLVSAVVPRVQATARVSRRIGSLPLLPRCLQLPPVQRISAGKPGCARHAVSSGLSSYAHACVCGGEGGGRVCACMIDRLCIFAFVL